MLILTDSRVCLSGMASPPDKKWKSVQKQALHLDYDTLLTLTARRKFFCLCTMFKIMVHFPLPLYPASDLLFSQPFAHTNSFLYSLVPFMCRVWNSLPFSNYGVHAHLLAFMLLCEKIYKIKSAWGYLLLWSSPPCVLLAHAQTLLHGRQFFLRVVGKTLRVSLSGVCCHIASTETCCRWRSREKWCWDSKVNTCINLCFRCIKRPVLKAKALIPDQEQLALNITKYGST